MITTYYISFNGSDYTQIHPSNSPVIKLTQDPGEMFFRWRVDQFRICKNTNTTVFATLLSWFTDTTKFTTDINYRIQENGSTTYEFKASIVSGKLDAQNNVYECTPSPDDDYTNLIRVYKQKFNGVGNVIVTDDISLYIPTLETALWTNVDFDTFIRDSDSVSWANTNIGVTETATIDFTIVTDDDTVTTVVIKNFTGDNFNMKLINESSLAISNEVTVTGNGKYEMTQNDSAINVFLEMSNSAPGVAKSGTFDYWVYYPSRASSDGSTLYNFINTFINDSDFLNLNIGTIFSTYLWNDALESDAPPNIDTYITANPANDYVIEGTANWNDLVVTHTQQFSSAPDSKLEMSLYDIMELLKIKLRAWWFIDSDGYFRIEHEKYFRDYAAQIDLTSYAADKPEVDKRIYTYDMSGVVSQINYTEMNQGNEDWFAMPVSFAPNVTSNEVRDVNMQLSTDIDYLRDNSADVVASGITLMRTLSTNNKSTVVIDESTVTAGEFYMNARLGWYYLSENYYTYFAEAGSGTVNGGAFVFDHVREYLKQDGVAFHPAAAINWKKPFTMANGTAWLLSADYTPETGMIVINVGFNPYE